MSFYLKCSFQKSKSIRNSFMIFTLNLLLQNHFAKFKHSKFPTIAKHKCVNKKISHVYNFNCFRISIPLGNKVITAAPAHLCLQNSLILGARERRRILVTLHCSNLVPYEPRANPEHHCVWLTQHLCNRKGQKRRTPYPSKALSCPVFLQEKEGSNNKNNKAPRKIIWMAHFTSCVQWLPHAQKHSALVYGVQR